MNSRAPNSTADFDRIARAYRWLEYLTLGRSLERCRLYFLPRLADRTRGLVLGDGDGRFLSGLLQQNPDLHADAVDTSGVMLHLLRERCGRASASSASRLTTHHADALTHLAVDSQASYDLVVTHFFLDCLTSAQVERLAWVLQARLTPGALWLISDFSVASGAMRLPSKVVIRGLYLAFRVFTGLRVTHLPDHHSALSGAGFRLSARQTSLFGILQTEIWALEFSSGTTSDLQTAGTEPAL